MSDKTIAAQGYRLRRAEADAKGAKRWKRRALEAEADARVARHAIDALFADRDAWRARAEKAEADARVARNELALERELYEQMHDLAIQYRRDSDKWAALAADATARAEKAEADLARYPTSAADAIICKQQMIEQRARADRYLSAIVEAERLATQGVRDINDGTWLSRVAMLLRLLVGEARRG